MSYLTQRAEQALLGALLTGGTPLPHQLPLLAEDFGHRAHRQVFTALSELSAAQPGLNGDELLDAVQARVQAPGANREWLHQVRDNAARPAHLPAYVRLIQASALRRDIAATAQRIEASGDNPRLAGALSRQAQAYRAITAEPAGTDRTPAAQPAQPAQPAQAWTAPPGGQTPAGEPATRAAREDLLLADLLQNAEQAGDLARVLTDTTFTSPQRREVYRTIISAAYLGDPVDEVIVALQLEQQRALALLYAQEIPPPEPADPGPEPAPAYLARLASTVTTVAAADIARDLIAEDFRTGLAQLAQSHNVPGLSGPAASREAPVREPAPGSPAPMPLDPPQQRPQPPQPPAPGPRVQP